MNSLKSNRLDSIEHLCWGMLFHMLGLRENEDSSFQDLTRKDKYKKFSELIQKHQELFEPEQWEDRSKNYKEIIRQLGIILDPAHMDSKCCATPPSNSLQKSDDGNYFNISKECDRSDKRRQADDQWYHGYSRDPFKEIKRIHKPHIALAAITYLVRAHALFFSRPRIKRDFNAAKVSLNDLFQAGQLGARLYYSLKNRCHIETRSQKEYFEDIQKFTYTEHTEPWNSSCYVWWVMEMVEIQRGNIYRAIHFLEEADRYYGHAQKRFDRLCTNHLRVADISIISTTKPDHSIDKWLVTPTLVSALFESSKVLFDRGLFIESLMNQLRCLAYLIRMPWKGCSNDQTFTEAEDILGDLQKALLFLDAVRKQYVWDTRLILDLFNQDKSARYTTGKITPDRVIFFLRSLDDPEKKLAVELFARLSFTLWGFQRKHEDNRWLQPYCKICEDLGVRQSSLSKYLLCTLFGEKSGIREPIPQDSVERQFAQRLREAIGNDAYSSDSLDTNAFFRKATTTVTNNIGNIVTLPRRLQSFLMRPGYKERRTQGDLSRKTVYDSFVSSIESSKDPQEASAIPNKFVVLRRWQSFNPKIPRPRLSRVKGGGYFLLWQGKGIAIDPGYDFIQNFYEEGFSLGDIDAIIVTHSHPDHDDDLSTLTVLAREWNEYHERMGHEESDLVKLDFFLNESGHLKFAAWLKAYKVGVGRIIPLPLVVWNNDSDKQDDALRGKNVFIRLRDKYSLDLEVVPAWHDDIIGKTAAVGLKFHLYLKDDLTNEIGIVGLTSDTGVYQVKGSDNKSTIAIEHIYKDCDVLVTHLGDIKLREIFSMVNGEYNLQDSIIEVLKDWFCNEKGMMDVKKVTQERVEAFYNLLVVLGIPDEKLFAAKLKFEGAHELIISKCLNSYIKQGTIDLRKITAEDLRRIIQAVRIDGDIEEVTQAISKVISMIKPKPKILNERSTKSGYECKKDNMVIKQKEFVFVLLGFLCASSYTPWNYEYHLGLSGILKLHQTMCLYEKKDRNRIFIVGELPEELSSYRHHVARLLNAMYYNKSINNKKKVHTFTGDIGLHIGLLSQDAKTNLTPKIRCAFCNYNNETVLRKNNYHDPDEIKETALRRLESSMIYLCTKHDHHPEGKEVTYDFLSSPNLRVI